MQGASPNSGPPHEVPAGASLRTSPPLLAPVRSTPVSTPLLSRPVLLPLSFVLTLVAIVGFGSAALTLAAAYLLFDQHPAAAQAAPTPVKTAALAVEPPRPEPVKEKPAPPAPDTLAILPFETLFEPTPAFQHEIEKLNSALPQLLSDAGKLRVKPLAQTAPFKYCRNPIEAAREWKVRAVLVVKFTTEPGQNFSTCHLELIDVESGFLLWGMEIEAPDGFLKHPERLTEIRQTIVEQVPKRMAPQQ
jgi:hypothetical protein